jgi:hypothetical protein
MFARDPCLAVELTINRNKPKAANRGARSSNCFFRVSVLQPHLALFAPLARLYWRALEGPFSGKSSQDFWTGFVRAGRSSPISHDVCDLSRGYLEQIAKPLVRH